jgi:hypothetical protein
MSTSFDLEDVEDWEFFDSIGAVNVEPSLALRDNERDWLDAYRKRLNDEFPGLAQDLLIYGPRARGHKQPNPGLNLLIILRAGDWETKDAVGSLGHLVDMDDHFAAPTIMVYTKDEWLDRERIGSDIFRSVMRSHVRV